MHAASLYYLTHITNVWGCMEILPIHCGAGSVKVNYYRVVQVYEENMRLGKTNSRLDYHTVVFISTPFAT